MADPVRTKVVTGVVGAKNASEQTAMVSFNTAMATAIANAAAVAIFPAGSNSQTGGGAPTDPVNIVQQGNLVGTYDGTNYAYASYITYFKYV